MRPSYDQFEPHRYEREIVPIVEEIREAAELDDRTWNRIVRKYPKDGRGAFSKSEIIRGFRHFAPHYAWRGESSFVAKVKMKPVRTQSGVAPVTVLTQPFPCPGRCIFCPSDVRMPKSYLSREPGAQRAAQYEFDPFLQTYNRILAFYNNGHQVDKIELIILGGTWSFYPETYQIWFVQRCFDALNEFEGGVGPRAQPMSAIRFRDVSREVDGRTMERTYNQVVSAFLGRRSSDRAPATGSERHVEASWESLGAAHRRNETSACRCVGLVVETRPDHLTEDEVVRIRRLGATKVQIGIQSLDDRVLELNRRGHDVAVTRRAFRLLRQAGFKLHAHWMPNLYGSTPARDLEDFGRIFDDPDFRPDELKIYPCSLIESAELMSFYERGEWRPYSYDELLTVLRGCLLKVPPYCRVTRVIRDIPGDDIFTGNRVTNFRQVVEKDLEERGLTSRDIRSREIRAESSTPCELRLDRVEYQTSAGTEAFLQFVTPDDRIVGFCRLALPSEGGALDEIEGSAMIREVHVYGVVVGLGERSSERFQHSGLGRRLIEEAAEIAAGAGFRDLAVIAAVGTRDYYRRLGFVDGELYQHRALGDDGREAAKE